MNNRNIISNKFNLNWSTTFSYTGSNAVAYRDKSKLQKIMFYIVGVMIFFYFKSGQDVMDEK
jgi:hypothetical protein